MTRATASLPAEARVFPPGGDITPPTNGYVRMTVPLTDLRAEDRVMRGVLDAVSEGREISDTPDQPILVRAVADSQAVVEIADGHHRVAQALLTGCTHIVADLDTVPDDEPYQPPFYGFSTPIPVP